MDKGNQHPASPATIGWVSRWNLRAPSPSLVRPVPIDPTGVTGPTKGQARGRSWRRSSPGLFVPVDTDRGKVEQRILEEAGRLPASGAVTGWAALRMHGVGYCDGLDRDGRAELPVPLVIPPGHEIRRSRGISVHRERLDEAERATRSGVPVTIAARAAFDEARRSGDLRSAVRVLDLALAAGVAGRRELAAFMAAKAGWRGLRLARTALDLADERCMSPQESALRMIWTLDARLPRPRSNWPVADEHGRFIGRPDLLCTALRVVGEFDGADHRSTSQHREDLRRDDRFRRAGLEPFRVVGADLHDRDLVVRRINAAVARAAHLPGTFMVKANPGPV